MTKYALTKLATLDFVGKERGLFIILQKMSTECIRDRSKLFVLILFVIYNENHINSRL